MRDRLRDPIHRIIRPGASRIARLLGYAPTPRLDDLDPPFWPLYRRCRPYTLTSVERMYALYSAVCHVCTHKVIGDVVECGVWRGGSAMLAALTLLACGAPRPLWLYDTFTGMVPPTAADVDLDGRSAAALLRDPRERLVATEADVRANLALTGYPPELTRLVSGRVEDTIPATAPAQIALLRLDTDFYASTRHELAHLYPRLSSGGVLIIDDYGHWQGARKAVDEYLASLAAPPLLQRVDYTGRMGVKP